MQAFAFSGLAYTHARMSRSRADRFADAAEIDRKSTPNAMIVSRATMMNGAGFVMGHPSARRP